MFVTLIQLWVALVLVLYALRAYCVLAMRSQSPSLYQQVGSPAIVSRYSWRFIYKVSRVGEFKQLSKGARYALHTTQLVFFVVMLLAAVLGCVTVVRLARAHHWF